MKKKYYNEKENYNFNFKCYSKLKCFTKCCINTDLELYPYDIIRIKKNLNISSENFLEEFTIPEFKDDFYFPVIKMKMEDSFEKKCQFLTKNGCKIYKDRPFACRVYPLECKTNRDIEKEISYCIVKHNYCLGHYEKDIWTIKKWINNQEIDIFNQYNKYWIDIDTIFRNNAWEKNKIHPEFYKLIFSACYNIDNFKTSIYKFLLPNFNIQKKALELAESSDLEMLKFGFQFVKFIFTGIGPLKWKNY